MMERYFDTVIIGAGPAGASCGITLQKSGASNCVIDKAVFPRHKTCAGLVTNKTLRLINKLLPDRDNSALFCDESRKIRLFQKTEPLAEGSSEHTIHITKRAVFDNALVTEYQFLGGTLLQGEKNVSVDEKNNRVLLSDGTAINYKTLVFADGAFSLSRKLPKADKPKLGFGIEVFVSKEIYSTDSIDLHFDYMKDGYVWVFPHGDTVCVGAGCNFVRDTDFRETFNKILSDMGIDAKDLKFNGAFFPYGNIPNQKKLPGNILLAGDAGGFADPISGEGLYMALQTGIYAAEAALTADPPKNYLGAIEPFERNIKDGKHVQNLFYSPAIYKTVMKKLKGNDRIVSFYFNNAVNECRYEYRDLRKLRKDYRS